MSGGNRGLLKYWPRPCWLIPTLMNSSTLQMAMMAGRGMGPFSGKKTGGVNRARMPEETNTDGGGRQEAHRLAADDLEHDLASDEVDDRHHHVLEPGRHQLGPAEAEVEQPPG